MIDAQLIQDVIRRESRSLLQYVGDAFPWTTVAEEEALGRLQTLIRAEGAAIAGLARFLFRHHDSPLPSGMYPSDFTTLNFVSLDHLLPLLIAHEERSIADLEAALPSAHDPESRKLLESFLALQRDHLKTLRELGTSARQPAVTA